MIFFKKNQHFSLCCNKNLPIFFKKRNQKTDHSIYKWAELDRFHNMRYEYLVNKLQSVWLP